MYISRLRRLIWVATNPKINICIPEIIINSIKIIKGLVGSNVPINIHKIGKFHLLIQLIIKIIQ